MNGMIGLLCAIWGFNWVIMKLANTVFPPVMFAALRFGLGALVLLVFCVYKKVPVPNKKNLLWIMVCGMLQTTFFNIAIQLSLNYISAGLTSVLTYSMPLWLTIMAHFLIEGERMTLRKGIGIAAGIVGVFFTLNARLGGNVGALLLALSSGLSWALSNIIIKRKLADCDNLQFTTWQMAIGAAGLFAYSACFEHSPIHIGLMPVVYVSFTGVIGSAFAFVLWFRILSGAEASKASISLLLVPVIGVLSGFLVLHESLTWMTAIGIAIVLLGIRLVNSAKASPIPQSSR